MNVMAWDPPGAGGFGNVRVGVLSAGPCPAAPTERGGRWAFRAPGPLGAADVHRGMSGRASLFAPLPVGVFSPLARPERPWG